MTEQKSIREALVPLLDRHMRVEGVIDERSGKWIAVSGYFKAMSGDSSETGNITLKTYTGNNDSVSHVFPLRGIISVYVERETLIWKKVEEPKPEVCGCPVHSGYIVFPLGMHI